METFKVTGEHVKLLKRTYVGWNDCEWGAPSIDPKRPYGDSYVIGSIGEILGIEPEEEGGDFKPEDEQYMMKLHKELETVLQIFLRQGSMIVGTYTRKNAWSGPWELVLKDERKEKINRIENE